MGARSAGRAALLGSLGRAAGALLLALLIALLRATWRVRLVGRPTAPGPRLLALWHGDLLGLTRLPRPLTALVSRSVDGDLAARTLGWLGFAVVRGSTSRAAVAGALGLVRRLRRGGTVAVALDGPRGPRHRANDRVLRVARQAAAPVLPVAAVARRRWVLASWDRFQIPAPFTTVYVVWGAPVAGDLERAMGRVRREAQALAAGGGGAAR